MRPDETCITGKGNPTIQGIPCSFHYEKAGKHNCVIFDWLKRLLKRKKTPKGLLDKIDYDLAQKFYSWCITLEETTHVAFGDECIKCGQCELENEFKLPQLLTLTVDKRTGRVELLCKYLDYDASADNGVDDFGYRCSIYGKPERPSLCVKFPDGKEINVFDLWLDGLELQNSRIPLCPARFKVVLP